MNQPACTIDELELIALLEGELTENRAGQLREHLPGCAACTVRLASLQMLADRLRAPLPGANDPAFVDAVEGRLPAAVPVRTGRLRAARLAFGLSAVAAVAAAVVILAVPRPPEYAARGTAAPWHALVSTALEIVHGETARPLRAGGKLVAGDGIAVSARNGHSRLPVYLMVFAVDARGEVHWIVPAWTDPAATPHSVAVPPGGQLPGRSGRTPEGPAAGKLQVLTLLTRAPLDVRAVESTLHAGRPLAAGDDRHLQTVEVQVASR